MDRWSFHRIAFAGLVACSPMHPQTASATPKLSYDKSRKASVDILQGILDQLGGLEIVIANQDRCPKCLPDLKHIQTDVQQLINDIQASWK